MTRKAQPTADKDMVERAKVAFWASLTNANAVMKWLDHDSMEEMISAAWVGFEGPLDSAIAAIPNHVDVERMRELLAQVAPMFPITTHDTPDYAEVQFGNGEGHSSQAMTMNPEHWGALNELIAALNSSILEGGAE